MIPIFILTLAADAGKLADGFRGIPFGPAAVMDTAPLPGCRPDSEPGFKWACATEVGGVPVTVSYGVEHGLYYATAIWFKLGYTEAATFRGVLTAAYGKGAPAKDYMRDGMDDWVWRDGSVSARFTYNQFSHLVSFFIMDIDLYKQVEAAKAIEAKQAIGDL